MKLISNFTHGDLVKVLLNEEIYISATVESIIFTKSKVYYDVLTDYALLEKIDSALVFSIEE